MKKAKVAIEVFIYILLIMAIILMSYRTLFPQQYYNIIKVRNFVVISDSMEPTIKTNSIISVKTNIEKYSIGDIITFKHDINNDGTTDLITHRIYDIIDDKYYTYSDNYHKVDDWTIEFDEIVGKVIRVFPYIGFLVPYIQKFDYSILLILLIFVVLLLYKTTKQ